MVRCFSICYVRLQFSFFACKCLSTFLLVFTRKIESKKKLVRLFVWISRSSFVLLTIFIKNKMRVWVAMAFSFFLELTFFAVEAVWRSWMSKILDFESVNGYFACEAIAIPSALLARYLLDTLKKGAPLVCSFP